jgi:hypothetical protein
MAATRRSAMPLKIAAALSLCGLAAPPAGSAAASPVIDFAKPADNIELWAKLEGDTSGKTVYRVSRMTAFGIPRPGYSVALFAMRSITKIEYRKVSGGYDSRWSACAIYVGADDDTPISEYRNPFTGKTIVLKPLCSQVTGARYTVDRGIEMTASFPLKSSIFGKPYVLDWRVIGDRASVDRVAHSEWTEPGSKKVKHEISIDSYSAKLADLNNPALTSIEGVYSYTLVTEWLTSMNMGDRPGSILWRSNGAKVTDPAQLPRDLVVDLERLVPGRLQAPLKW